MDARSVAHVTKQTCQEVPRQQTWLNYFYAFDTCNCIDDREIGVEELADIFSEIFGVEIKNCYNVHMNMKHRKDDSRTYFLDEL